MIIYFITFGIVILRYQLKIPGREDVNNKDLDFKLFSARA
jgi:hypothetical protein